MRFARHPVDEKAQCHERASGVAGRKWRKGKNEVIVVSSH